MAKKATKAEIESRVSAVLGLILDGVSTSEIVRQGADQWGMKRRGIEKYITKAYKILEKNAKKERRENIQWHMESRKRNLFRLIEEKDFRGVSQQLKDMADLQGLYPKRKVLVETKGFTLTRDEVLAELNKFAEIAGLSLEDYCKREDIDLNQVKDIAAPEEAPSYVK